MEHFSYPAKSKPKTILFTNIPRMFGNYTFLDGIQIYQILTLHSKVSACSAK